MYKMKDVCHLYTNKGMRSSFHTQRLEKDGIISYTNKVANVVNNNLVNVNEGDSMVQ